MTHHDTNVATEERQCECANCGPGCQCKDCDCMECNCENCRH